MNDGDDIQFETGEHSASRFHILQANRDLQSNWELDLAKNLEEYLLKICSGEISDERECSINFAEAALLVQGSVQVYSRKVEYLHSLVLAALEFLSQKRQDEQENTTEQPDGTNTNAVVDDDDEVFLGLDDIPVDPKNCLDHGHDKDDDLNNFVKPPANLLVLEGDCLDSSGDASELESYLLATCIFYRDFLLLDPSDAGAVSNFLKSNGTDQEQQPSIQRGSSMRSKHIDNVFTSPTRKSTPRKSTVGKNQGVNLDDILENNDMFEQNNENQWSAPNFNQNYSDEEQNFGVSGAGDDIDSDDDDPWKPLNPHEHGNLKIKPFKASMSIGRQVIRNSKPITAASRVPIAKPDSIISPELAELSEVQTRLQEKFSATQSPPFFEKLRRSFVDAEENAFNGNDHDYDDNDAEDFPDFDHADFDLPNNTYDMNTVLSHDKNGDTSNYDGVGGFSQDDPSSQASLEDLCRSHLDALLASIAETEKQTELAARVSTWKQRIEQNLEEQESHPPFDIHLYGDFVLDKLFSEADTDGSMTFTDVVKGRPKHDVARTFSALLQLVNNGDVTLEKAPPSKELMCYTSKKPFRVKLLRPNKKRNEMKIPSARKRAKSPSKDMASEMNQCNSDIISPIKQANQNGKSIKLGKGTAILRTPDGKRRRRSSVEDTIDIRPDG